jgi:hypothetical protein
VRETVRVSKLSLPRSNPRRVGLSSDGPGGGVQWGHLAVRAPIAVEPRIRTLARPTLNPKRAYDATSLKLYLSCARSSWSCQL